MSRFWRKANLKESGRLKYITIRSGWQKGLEAAIIATLLSCTSDEVQDWYKRFDAGEKPNL